MKNDRQDHENRPTYSRLTEDERAQVRTRTAEAAVFRQTLADHALAQGLALAPKLKALREG
jgi:hypothetical protein